MLLMACSLITGSYILNILWIKKYIKYTIYEKDSEKLEIIRRSLRTITALEIMVCKRGMRRFILEKGSYSISHHS